MGKGSEQTLVQENIQMANMPMKKGSKLAAKRMQIKTSERLLYTHQDGENKRDDNKFW